MISDPTVDPQRLVDTVRSLGPVSEPPEVWSDVAADPRYPVAQRRTAVLQLVLRHDGPGTGLLRLGRLLAGAPWLADSDVELVEDVGGWLPVRPGRGATVVRVAVLPDGGPVQCAIYLALAERIEPAEVVMALRGAPGARDVEIVEAGTVPLEGIDAG